MKKLTKKQYESLGSYAGSNDVNHNILYNGQIGYYKAKEMLVVCCGSCGHYHRVKTKTEIVI
jgi:hypothetical protein